MTIGYLDELTPEYAEAIAAAKNETELRAVLQGYELLAGDALDALDGDFDWDEFQRGTRTERRGKYAGDEWAKRYSAILMPELMMRVQLVAERYRVPFGCAFIRCEEAGLLSVQNGRGVWSAQAQEAVR